MLRFQAVDHLSLPAAVSARLQSMGVARDCSPNSRNTTWLECTRKLSGLPGYGTRCCGSSFVNTRRVQNVHGDVSAVGVVLWAAGPASERGDAQGPGMRWRVTLCR
ncbi:hypothetical protein DPEC_G00071070 [Dallia pectoralis]|uniref:Uncharacterized protein n=1 Tax=Dallia pectoralis TaxID=75939 RepID=A0ACC2H2S2_DALPE|nr:hypothetical protein DPEC_G00071070 [Dallia pectoralis]